MATASPTAVTDDDFGEFVLAVLVLVAVLALIASIVFGFWVIVHPEQRLLMAERCSGSAVPSCRSGCPNRPYSAAN